MRGWAAVERMEDGVFMCCGSFWSDSFYCGQSRVSTVFVKKILEVFVEAHLHPASGIPAAADEGEGVQEVLPHCFLLSGFFSLLIVDFEES
jgi:hypothetical protein